MPGVGFKHFFGNFLGDLGAIFWLIGTASMLTIFRGLEPSEFWLPISGFVIFVVGTIFVIVADKLQIQTQ